MDLVCCWLFRLVSHLIYALNLFVESARWNIAVVERINCRGITSDNLARWGRVAICRDMRVEFSGWRKFGAKNYRWLFPPSRKAAQRAVDSTAERPSPRHNNRQSFTDFGTHSVEIHYTRASAPIDKVNSTNESQFEAASANLKLNPFNELAPVRLARLWLC